MITIPHGPSSPGGPGRPDVQVLAPLTHETVPGASSKPPKKEEGDSEGPLRLTGQIGTSALVETTLTLPGNLVTLAEVKVAGGDAEKTGSPGIRAAVTVQSSPATISLMHTILEFGSGGMQGTSALIQLATSQSFVTPGDWLRISVRALGTGSVRIGAFTNLATHPAGQAAYNVIDRAAVAVGATVSFSVPYYASDVVVHSSNPLLDSFLLELLDFSAAVSMAVSGPQPEGTRLPLTGDVRSINVTNTGVAALTFSANSVMGF